LSSLPRSLTRWAIPSLFAAAGTVMACYPILFSGFARMQNDPEDTRLIHYMLEHDYLWLVRAPLHRDLWSPPIFYPEANTAAYTELTLGLLPLYAPWRAVGLAPDTAFQSWILTSLLLNFAAIYFFLRRCLAVRPVAASFGSFLFAFGSPRLNQLNHQFMLPQFFTVLAVFAVWRLFQIHATNENHHRCVAWIAALASSVAAQIYATYALGWFLCFALLIAFALAMAMRSTRGQIASVLRAHWRAIALIAAVAAAALTPLGLHYLEAARAVGFRQFWEAEGMLPRFQSWFYMGEENWLYGWTAGRGSFAYLPVEWEQRLGLGLVTTAVVGWALIRERRRPGIRILIGTWLAILLTATMYRWGFSPWKWIFKLVPGANGIRAVARIGILALIPASIGLALFADRRREPKWKALAFSLSAFCLLEQGRRSLSYDKQTVRTAVSRVAARIDPACRAFFCVCQDDRAADECQLDGMWAGLQAKLPTVNGTSGNNPARFEPLSENKTRTEADEARLKAALETWLRAHRKEGLNVCWVEASVQSPSDR